MEPFADSMFTVVDHNMESYGNMQDHEISGVVSSVILGSKGFNSHL